MGSASTGQVISEALGLALPGTALIPSPLTRHLRVARAAGKQVLRLVEQDLRPSKILTRESFHNAIVLHAAVGGLDEQPAAPPGDRPRGGPAR